jgi:hypothetical protein
MELRGSASRLARARHCRGVGEGTGNSVMEQHRARSRATILRLANSLAAEEPLRTTFLSAPAVAKILGDG